MGQPTKKKGGLNESSFNRLSLCIYTCLCTYGYREYSHLCSSRFSTPLRGIEFFISSFILSFLFARFLFVQCTFSTNLERSFSPFFSFFLLIRTRTLTGGSGWKCSKLVSILSYGWFILGVVWVFNAHECTEAPGLWKLTVSAVSRRKARWRRISCVQPFVDLFAHM